MKDKYGSLVVSGLPCSGKSALVRRLHEETNWPIHSIGDLFRGKLKKLQESGEADKSLTIKDWWPTVPDEEQIKVNKDLLELASKGKIIADTRYAFYLKGSASNPLFVFLTANLGVRAKRVMISKLEYQGKPLEKIMADLNKREIDEVEMGLRLFGRDYRFPSDYDLILDSERLSIEQEASKVIGYLKMNAA